MPNYGAQRKLPLQTVVEGHEALFGKPQSVFARQLHETAPNALDGATSDAITGNATIEARPIVFSTCRRDWP